MPQLAGATVMEMMHDFAAHHDRIRRALVLEPRGRGLTSAVVLLPPTRPDASGTVDRARVEITGRAYLTADSTIYLDEDDELAGGFQLG